jgi:branched-chain amino acid transport system permease protein
MVWFKKHQFMSFAFAAIFLLCFPFLFTNDYYQRIAITVLLYVVLATSLNIINGYSGQFNIGHAAFYCVGAYVAAILATRYHLSFWLLLPVCGAAASLASCFLGLPTLRLKGIFLAMCTLGFSEIVRLTALNWISLTRGPMGIPGVPFPKIFGVSLKYNWQFYYVILAIAAFTIFTSHRVINSRIGRAWIAIREDELAARSMGVPTFWYKLLNLLLALFGREWLVAFTPFFELC